jgi:hypothetical protein
VGHELHNKLKNYLAISRCYAVAFLVLTLYIYIYRTLIWGTMVPGHHGFKCTKLLKFFKIFKFLCFFFFYTMGRGLQFDPYVCDIYIYIYIYIYILSSSTNGVVQYNDLRR